MSGVFQIMHGHRTSDSGIDKGCVLHSGLKSAGSAPDSRRPLHAQPGRLLYAVYGMLKLETALRSIAVSHIYIYTLCSI